MATKIEIFDKNGNLIYGSDRFTPIRFSKKFKMGTISPNGSTGGSHNLWYFKLNLDIPPVDNPERKIMMLTPIGTIWNPSKGGTKQDGIICMKSYPNKVDWNFLVNDMNRDCFILEV